MYVLLCAMMLSIISNSQSIEKVVDLCPTDGSTPTYFQEVNNKLLFFANDGINGWEPFISDGTAAGTSRLGNYSTTLAPSTQYYLSDGNVLYFSFTSSPNIDLWITDGTSGNTKVIKNFYRISKVFKYNGKTYIIADDGQTGFELWETDGTSIGTKLVIDLNPAGSGFLHGEVIEYKNELYFDGWDGINEGLWCTDGTLTNTHLVKQINLTNNSGIKGLINYNNKLFFRASDNTSGNTYNKEPWVSDGTETGTNLFLDFAPGTASSGEADNFTANGYLYLLAGYWNGNPKSLYYSDGTDTGTHLIISSIYSGITHATAYKGKLYFIAEDSTGIVRLWVTDNTLQGTEIIESSDGKPFEPISLVAFDNKLFFIGKSSDYGYSLWASDGTNATTRIFELAPALFSNNLSTTEPIVYNSSLYFTATYDYISGFELWRYNPNGNPTNVTGLHNTENSYRVYPNPASNYINIENLTKGDIIITNTMGLIVHKGFYSGKHQIDVSKFPTGLYYVRSVRADWQTVFLKK